MNSLRQGLARLVSTGLFPGPPDVGHTLTVGAPGQAPTRLDTLSPGERPFDVRRATPARIEGTVDLEGAPYRGPVEFGWGRGTSLRVGDAAGRAIPVPALRVGRGGSYSLQGLPAGALQVRGTSPQGPTTRREALLAPGAAIRVHTRTHEVPARGDGKQVVRCGVLQGSCG